MESAAAAAAAAAAATHLRHGFLKCRLRNVQVGGCYEAEAADSRANCSIVMSIIWQSCKHILVQRLHNVFLYAVENKI